MSAARIPGIGLVLFGVAVGLEATTFDVAFLTDPVGPKALPMLVAVLCVLAGVHATLDPPPIRGWSDRGTALRVAGAAVAFALYAPALPVLGFFVATTVVVGALARLYGAPLRHGVPAAAALAATLWLLFVQLLALPLPIGSLWTR